MCSMSGGEFDYKQNHIYDVADSIQCVIDQNDSDETDEHGDRVGHEYSKAVIRELKNAVAALTTCNVAPATSG